MAADNDKSEASASGDNDKRLHSIDIDKLVRLKELQIQAKYFDQILYKYDLNINNKKIHRSIPL